MQAEYNLESLAREKGGSFDLDLIGWQLDSYEPVKKFVTKRKTRKNINCICL